NISSSSSISLQTAEKARSAVPSYFYSHEHSDGTDVNTWCVREYESREKHGYGNPARDPLVRQFMRGLKKKKASDMCRINEVLTFKWKDMSLRQYYPSVVAPHEVIEYGAYALFNRKTAVAEERMYSLHHVAKDELAISAYMHLCNWMDYAFERKGHQWRDDDFVFPALNYISKKVFKTNDAATGCEKVCVRWGKNISEQVFITLLICIVRGLNRVGKHVIGYVTKHGTSGWFTSHTFRRAGAQYRFM
ncbi:hypothetical protein PC120_g26596, partial [Phytophthora cactorum]